MEFLAIILATATAASWAFVTQLQKKGLQNTDAQTGALIVVLSFAGLFWTLAPFMIEWHWFGTRSAFIFAISGLVVPGLAQQFHMMSVDRLGPTMTSVAGAFAPAFAIAPAMLFLGETLNLQGSLGIAMMVGGVIFAVQANSTDVRQFSITMIWIAVVAAACRGLGQPIAKLGLTDLPQPFFATLVMATSAAFLIGGVQCFRDEKTVEFRFGSHVLWFVAAGFVLAFGFLALYAALDFGDVVVVAPFTATVPIWILLFNYFIFKTETINAWHVLAAIVATLGVIVLITR